MTDPRPQPQPSAEPAVRKRPKPGERRHQILQTLAGMLELPGGERVTTASLAARLEVSEAALYRHFASKAQMFEGLIEFIEQTVFTLVNQIAERARPEDGTPGAGERQALRVLAMLLQFAERNPGMARVMVGDALVLENERLLQRMNLLFDKIEATLRQCLRADAGADGGSAHPTLDAQVRAAVLVAFALGRLQRFVRTGFRRLPTEHLDAALAVLRSAPLAGGAGMPAGADPAVAPQATGLDGDGPSPAHGATHAATHPG